MKLFSFQNKTVSTTKEKEKDNAFLTYSNSKDCMFYKLMFEKFGYKMDINVEQSKVEIISNNDKNERFAYQCCLHTFQTETDIIFGVSQWVKRTIRAIALNYLNPPENVKDTDLYIMSTNIVTGNYQ